MNAPLAMPTKAQILALLDAWIRQRPGLDAANYFGGGDYRANLANYRNEVRSIGRDLAEARQLLRAVEMSGIEAPELMDAFRAYSGRLTIEAHPTKPGLWRLSYCTGQYWPTEYRRAACAVLASALWAYKRDRCMPPPLTQEPRTYAFHGSDKSADAVSAGEWLRRSFKREFGRGMADRWFS